MNEEVNRMIVEETYPFLTIFRSSKSEENELFKLQITKRSPKYVFDEFIIEDTVQFTEIDKNLKDSDWVPAMKLTSLSLDRNEM